MAKRKLETKLTLESVVKWIRNLEDGSYNKGTGELVSPSGKNFCCLGVWADMHGCRWDEEMRPVLPGKTKTQDGQGTGSLKDTFAFGLSGVDQAALTQLNDSRETWDAVIDYIKIQVLPYAQ